MAVEFALDADTALMLKVAKDDGPSFDLLLGRHRTTVVNHLYRLVHNRDIAEELAQDVFIRVYRSRAKYQPDAKFTTWLFRITTNVALNWRRDTRHESAYVPLDSSQLLDRVPRADELLLRQYRAKQVRAAVEKLPQKQQVAVLMHKYEGMEYAEIAEAMQCSIPALKSLLFRAYETLRQRLAHFAPGRVA